MQRIVTLTKGNERYVFRYTDETNTELLRTLGRYAADPELSFSWYDAAVVSQKIRKKRHTKFQSHNRLQAVGALQ